MSNQGTGKAQYFLKNSTKEITIPCGATVLIKKINAMSYLSGGSLPTSIVVRQATGKKGKDGELIKDVIQVKIEGIKNRLQELSEKGDELSEKELESYYDLEKQLGDIITKKTNDEIVMVKAILKHGLVDPLFSLDDIPAEGCINIDMLSPEDTNFIVREIQGLSGISGKEAEDNQESFREEQE